MAGKVQCDHIDTKTRRIYVRENEPGASKKKRAWVPIGYECVKCGTLVRGEPE